MKPLLNKIFREEWRKTAKWGLFLAVAAYCVVSHAAPSSHVVKQIYAYVKGVGYFIIFIPAAKAAKKERFWDMARITLRGGGAYVIALWLIGRYGDAIHQWIYRRIPTPSSR